MVGNIHHGELKMTKYKNLVGYFSIEKEDEEIFHNRNKSDINYSFKYVDNKKIYELENIMTNEEINILKKLQNSNNKIQVGIDGYVKNYKSGDTCHSLRSTIYSDYIANILFERIKHLLSDIKSPYHEGNDLFTPIGVNPAMRFIEYTNNGLLIPHYDFPYVKNENELSLLTLVMYLTDTDDGGATRYIKEYRHNDYSDLLEPALEKDVLYQCQPKIASGLLFPHQMLHDSQSTKNDKIIIRTDVMYKRII